MEIVMRPLLNSAIGIGAFLLTCIVIRSLLSFPQIDGVTEKLRFFAAHKDEFEQLVRASEIQ
jgi:hypothetical protein